MYLDSRSLRPRLLFRVSHSAGSGLTSTSILPLVQAPTHLIVSELEQVAETARRTSLTYFKACIFINSGVFLPRITAKEKLIFFFPPGEIHGVAWPSVPENIICCSVIKLCLTLCSPMGCSMPGFRVLHYLPEFAQTHVH